MSGSDLTGFTLQPFDVGLHLLSLPFQRMYPRLCGGCSLCATRLGLQCAVQQIPRLFDRLSSLVPLANDLLALRRRILQ